MIVPLVLIGAAVVFHKRRKQYGFERQEEQEDPSHTVIDDIIAGEAEQQELVTYETVKTPHAIREEQDAGWNDGQYNLSNQPRVPNATEDPSYAIIDDILGGRSADSSYAIIDDIIGGRSEDPSNGDGVYDKVPTETLAMDPLTSLKAVDHGSIDRSTAEQRLRGKDEGSYLLRRKREGQIVVSYVTHSGISHILAVVEGNGYRVDGAFVAREVLLAHLIALLGLRFPVAETAL